MEEKEKKILTKIKDVKDSILGTISDADERRIVQDKMAVLLALQAQSDVEAVELVVPTKSVVRSADFETFYIKQTTHGFLFGVKGGLSTFVDARQKTLCEMFREFLDMHEKNYANVDEGNRELCKDYFDIWCMIMQTPLFCAIDPQIAISVATTLVAEFGKFAKENVDNAKLTPETEEAVASQIDDEQQQAFIKELFNSLPQKTDK